MQQPLHLTPPASSTHEDLTPLPSPWLSISLDSFIRVCSQSSSHRENTKAVDRAKKEIPAANHKGALNRGERKFTEVSRYS